MARPLTDPAGYPRKATLDDVLAALERIERQLEVLHDLAEGDEERDPNACPQCGESEGVIDSSVMGEPDRKTCAGENGCGKSWEA